MAFLFVACSDVAPADVSIAVRIQFDAESCGVSQPEEVQIACSGMLNLWLVDVARDTAEVDDCYLLPPQQMNLGMLPDILQEQAHIEDIQGSEVQLGISIMTGDVPQCPGWPAVQSEMELSPVRGLSPVIDLRRDSAIPVSVACREPIRPPDIGSDNECSNQCQINYDLCQSETGEDGFCLQDFELCLAACEDKPPSELDPLCPGSSGA